MKKWMSFLFIANILFPLSSFGEIFLPPNFLSADGLEPRPAPLARGGRSDQIEFVPDIGSPDEVLVIVNQNSDTSVAIGEYYVQLRGIPDINLCILDCSTSEVIKREEYVGNIYFPIKDYLETTGLKERIKYFVTTKGVPLKITGKFSYTTQMASVDAELVMLDYGSYQLNGWYPNPYYNKGDNLNRDALPLYLVNRLTAYDIDEDANDIPDDIESYLQKGLYPPDEEGRFVLDVDPLYDGRNGYSQANDWIREAARILREMGAEVLMDETSQFLMYETGVIGYCSWGSNDHNDQIHGEPFFEWVNGAIATTYVSTNARTFKYPPSYGQSMIADLIQEGITGVYGNVYEPYLTACARPHILFPTYYTGYNLAESYYMSLRYISWMEIVVGDPLCAPFAQKMPRVYITTNQIIYTEGDFLKVNVDIWNPGDKTDVRLYIALNIDGYLYFYPEWKELPSYEVHELQSKSRKRIAEIVSVPITSSTIQGDFAFYSAITDLNGNVIGKLSAAYFELR